MAMTWESAETNWAEFKGQLKIRWGKITNAHLESIAGKRANLLTTLQKLYEIPLEEAEKQVVSFEQYSKDIKPKVAS